jgi:hypothetical protein
VCIPNVHCDRTPINRKKSRLNLLDVVFNVFVKTLWKLETDQDLEELKEEHEKEEEEQREKLEEEEGP